MVGFVSKGRRTGAPLGSGGLYKLKISFKLHVSGSGLGSSLR